jgi:aminodeoxyfutalosine synthase
MLIPESSSLADIAVKVEQGERLSKEDGLRLLNSTDILEVGRLADYVRRKKAGDVATFVGNYHICFSNICINSCKYCVFRRNEKDPDAFTMSLDEIEAEAQKSKEGYIPEILFLGGLHPSLTLDFFEKALNRIRKTVPDIHILGFSPVEIDYFARQEGVSCGEVLERLKKAGLTAITGGGAEIFSPRVREKLACPQKIGGERWLEIMETAHSREIYSNASMLYGFVENFEERIDHLIQIRDLQDKTNGFTHFLPFAFSWPDHPSTTGYDDIKMLSVSRLMLDNFTHIRAYWAHLGLKVAQTALSFGADDLNGITQKGRIIHSSGAVSRKKSSAEAMVKIIRDAGRIPAERDVLFNIIRENF